MNATYYDSATNLVSVQPGGQWGDVYDTLAPHGVTVTGGRSAAVGVGGFLLGGGNSFHSASHGFGCDNVANFEVVLADGRIVEANSVENNDLWVALRGGSGNFGLVTRFDMFAIEYADPGVPHIWGGGVIYDINATDHVAEAFVKFAEYVGDDESSSSIVFWGYLPSMGGLYHSVSMENINNVASPPAFDAYLSLDGIISNNLRSETMLNITTAGDGAPGL